MHSKGTGVYRWLDRSVFTTVSSARSFAVVVGISPPEDFVVFHEESQRWLLPDGDEVAARKGKHLVDVDREVGPAASSARSRRSPSWWRAKA